MLDDVARMGHDAGAQHCAFGNLHALEQVILVFVAGVRGLERELPGVHLEHVVDDVLERGFIQARAFIDAVARVEADFFRRKPLDCRVHGLDENLRAAFLLFVVESLFDKDIGKKRVVHLHDKAGIDNGLVFLAHLGGERVEILFVGFVVFVLADARWCGCG